MTDDSYLHSTLREKTIEHIFIGECLRWLWAAGRRDAEVLHADVDAGGYDLVMEAGGIIRHVQLKSSHAGGKARDQKVNAKLMDKPSGCVIWISFEPKTIELGPFYWFGGEPGEALPDITGFKPAKHTKADARGQKASRRNTFCIPKSRFDTVPDLNALMQRLFGPLGERRGP